jgi:hypothetical protein
MGSSDRVSPEVADLSRALDELVESAKNVRFANQVWVDRKKVYEILDGLRASLPGSIKELRWYRKKREDAGDPPLGSSLADDSLDVLGRIDELDDLLHKARPAPFNLSTVRVKRERLMESVGKLQAWLVPFAKELSDCRSVHPELREEVLQAESRNRRSL